MICLLFFFFCPRKMCSDKLDRMNASVCVCVCVCMQRWKETGERDREKERFWLDTQKNVLESKRVGAQQLGVSIQLIGNDEVTSCWVNHILSCREPHQQREREKEGGWGAGRREQRTLCLIHCNLKWNLIKAINRSCGRWRGGLVLRDLRVWNIF